MSEAAGKTAELRDAVAVQCDSCGGRFRARRWHEGLVCPRCHSGEVRPLVAPGGAVDYYVADRSEGYAPADVRVAQWAKWTELITPNQYELAFIKQNRQIQEDVPPDPIHEIMMAEGWISREQATRLLEFMSLSRPNSADEGFAEIAISSGKGDPDKVRRIQALQLKASTSHHEVPPLCQLLMERRVISEAEMLAILQMQEQQGGGALKTVHEMAVKPTRKSPIDQVKGFLASTDSRVRYFTIIAGVFILALGIWHWQSAKGENQVYVTCSHCGQIQPTTWPEDNKFPIKCPFCGNRKASFAMICENDHIFGVENPFAPHTCPQCGTSAVRKLKKEDLDNRGDGG